MLSFLVASLVLPAALLLLFTGAWKVAQPTDITATLTALGIHLRHAAAVVGAIEMVAGAGLFLAAETGAMEFFVLGLATVFASAAAIAMRRGLSIECACFGPIGRAMLGTRQLIALPAWVVVAALGGAAPSPLSLLERAELLCAILIILMAFALTHLTKQAREHRYLRLLLAERQ